MLAPPLVPAPSRWVQAAVAHRGGVYFRVVRLGDYRAVAWASPWTGFPYRDGGPQEPPDSPSGRRLEAATSCAGYAFRSRADALRASGAVAAFPGRGEEPLAPFCVRADLGECVVRRIPVTVDRTLVSPQGALASEGGSVERLPIAVVQLELPDGGDVALVGAPIFSDQRRPPFNDASLVRQAFLIQATAQNSSENPRLSLHGGRQPVGPDERQRSDYPTEVESDLCTCRFRLGAASQGHPVAGLDISCYEGVPFAREERQLLKAYGLELKSPRGQRCGRCGFAEALPVDAVNAIEYIVKNGLDVARAHLLMPTKYDRQNTHLFVKSVKHLSQARLNGVLFGVALGADEWYLKDCVNQEVGDYDAVIYQAVQDLSLIHI